MTESADLVIQPAGHNAVQQALYLAISWNEDPLIPTLGTAMQGDGDSSVMVLDL